jgi:hypothetical protein
MLASFTIISDLAANKIFLSTRSRSRYLYPGADLLAWGTDACKLWDSEHQARSGVRSVSHRSESYAQV